jgi:hypothetical protein
LFEKLGSINSTATLFDWIESLKNRRSLSRPEAQITCQALGIMEKIEKLFGYKFVLKSEKQILGQK